MLCTCGDNNYYVVCLTVHFEGSVAFVHCIVIIVSFSGCCF